jgi:cation diffusion facilitator CzcD-associated flavoprotein CzcO
MPDADILIVGGGPAGLTTAGALKHVGFDSTILDGGERIGQSWEQRYDRLHLHTVRAYSGLAHFPIPRKYPKYLSKDQYANYLRDYAAHFDLKIVRNSLVKRVRQKNENGRPAWEAVTQTETWAARVVVITTGQYNRPIYPDWPGLAQYQGESLHSSKYRTGRGYQNQKVLVIGAGNSGLEIAVDLVEQGAEKVVVSIRSGPPMVPRDFLGVPAQAFGMLMTPFPPALSDQIVRLLSRVALGDLQQFGLPSPDWMPFSSSRTPILDVGFATALKKGKVEVRPAVRSFTSSGVTYQDGRVEPFDTVIFATGFHTGLDELLEPEGLIDQNGSPRFASGAPTSYPGLYFMGYFDTLRGSLYESNLASQRLAREVMALESPPRGSPTWSSARGLTRSGV